MIRKDHADLYRLPEVGSKLMGMAKGVWDSFSTIITVNRNLWKPL
jgi:hypothetical protein